MNSKGQSPSQELKEIAEILAAAKVNWKGSHISVSDCVRLLVIERDAARRAESTINEALNMGDGSYRP